MAIGRASGEDLAPHAVHKLEVTWLEAKDGSRASYAIECRDCRVILIAEGDAHKMCWMENDCGYPECPNNL